MKNLSLALIALMLFGCGKKDEDVSPIPPVEKSTVSLNFNGDIFTSFDDYLPSRTLAPEDLTYFGIIVSRVDSDSNELFYANGVFNSEENVTVDLNPTESYRFEVVAVSKGTGYGLVVSNGNVSIANGLFPISNAFSFEEMNNFRVHYPYYYVYNSSDSTSNTRFINSAPVDAFYEESDLFTIGSDTSITIDLMRVSYGLGFDVENLTSGEVHLDVGSLYDIVLTPENADQNGIYCFPTYHSNVSENHTHDFLVSASKIERDSAGNISSNILLGSQTIQVERNIMRVFHFELDDTGEALTNTNTLFSFDEDMTIEQDSIVFD